MMLAFYAELCRGETVAGALRRAQIRIAHRPGMADPFYWAGYVLVGDGDVRIPLRRRVQPGPVLLMAGGALSLIGAASWWNRRARSAVPQADPL
jgi:hypothetical protein